MTRKPSPVSKAAKALEAASRPVEAVGQTLERAFKQAAKQARQFAEAAPSASLAASPKGEAMPISPLAVPFPKMPPIAGVQMATSRAGFYKHERDDLLVMSFPDGASCAGVFTRQGVGSAPVDW
ncbi:MAG TPA: bifunctional ornithine acetyltransferase/N-acetylglutamate synthase, partial [Phenylobacterium sp.]|nr:bifunctional ornithine acetyltransferase/N-acetylglutamate synthase [Phenylobacterium sp.]